MLKFKNEWGMLNEIAKASRLNTDETVLLFALREVEAGKKNNEFNKINVQNTSLAVQADSMATQIQKGEFLYQKYCKGLFQPLLLEPNEKPMDFVDFLGQVLMPNEGARKDKKWLDAVKLTIKEINYELGEKDANVRHP